MLNSWKLVMLFVLLSGLLTMAGCSEDDPIVGTWKLYSVDGELVGNEVDLSITFTEDGDYTMTAVGEGWDDSESGSYSTAGSTLTVNPAGDDSWTSTFSISGDTMTISDEESVTVLKRQ